MESTMTDTLRPLPESEYEWYIERAKFITRDTELIDGLPSGDILALWRTVAYQADLIEELLEERRGRGTPRVD
jgi:hypothetical protein